MQTICTSEHATAASQSLVTTLVLEVTGDEPLSEKWRAINQHVDDYTAVNYPNIKSRGVIMVNDGTNGNPACYVVQIISHEIGGEDR